METDDIFYLQFLHFPILLNHVLLLYDNSFVMKYIKLHYKYKFYNTENLHGADLKLQSVYYLTGSSTASASEATILMTRSHIPTTLIGGRTVGKGVGMYSITSEEYPFTLVPITFRYYDANMNTIPDEGLEPDIEIEDVYPKRQQDIGEITEPLLKKAIECITLNDSDEDSDNTD